jgi:hypothetical protein
MVATDVYNVQQQPPAPAGTPLATLQDRLENYHFINALIKNGPRVMRTATTSGGSKRTTLSHPTQQPKRRLLSELLSKMDPRGDGASNLATARTRVLELRGRQRRLRTSLRYA